MVIYCTASCDKPGQGQGWQMDAPLLKYSPQRSAWCQFLQCHQQRGSRTKITTMGECPFRRHSAASAQCTLCSTTQTWLVRMHCQTRHCLFHVCIAPTIPAWWLLTFHSWWFVWHRVIFSAKIMDTHLQMFLFLSTHFAACAFKIYRELITACIMSLSIILHLFVLGDRFSSYYMLYNILFMQH